jgi:hypothetical protein
MAIASTPDQTDHGRGAGTPESSRRRFQNSAGEPDRPAAGQDAACYRWSIWLWRSNCGVVGGQMDFTPVHPDEFLNQKTEPQAPETNSTKISIIGSIYTVSAAMRFGMGLQMQEPISIAERYQTSLSPCLPAWPGTLPHLAFAIILLASGM